MRQRRSTINSTTVLAINTYLQRAPASVFLLLLLVSPNLYSPVLASDYQPLTLNTANQRPQLYKGFFPYQACILVTIDKVETKTKPILLLKATVESSYLGNFLKGSPLVVGFYEDLHGPNTFSFLSSLKTTKQIIAFNRYTDHPDADLKRVSRNPIRNLWLPFAPTQIQESDVAQIKELIKASPTQPKQRRAAFQKLLETKWTPERINDFCRPETRKTLGQATEHAANYPDDWYPNPMHLDKTNQLNGMEITWQASADMNTPTWFNIHAFSPTDKMAWDLEASTPSIENWSDDEFTAHRIGYSLKQAAWAYWIIHRDHRPAIPAYYSLVVDRLKEQLVRDKIAHVRAYQCLLSDGTTLTATLSADHFPTIDKILINGDLDMGWTEMYKNNLKNLEWCQTHQ
jgi:hypothetical protein